MSKIRTRFAPSPTGRMHVGNLRTALYAYLFLHISHRNLSRSRFLVGIIGKPECERMNLASVSIRL